MTTIVSRPIRTAWSTALSILASASSALAVDARGNPDPFDGAACAACGSGFVFVILTMFALNIAMLVWVARDAKSRGMDSSVLWMLLVMLTGPIGLILYFLSRPQGELSQCGSCGNKRLRASAKCPHCGNA